jgi:hypothetical protein
VGKSYGWWLAYLVYIKTQLNSQSIILNPNQWQTVEGLKNSVRFI